MIIGLFGQREHGKSTIAKMIQKHINITHNFGFNGPYLPITPFAQKIKDIICDVYKLTPAQLEELKRTDVQLVKWLCTVRDSMKKLGDCFRGINPDTLVDYVLQSYNHCIIDDGRFFDEAAAIKAKGGINIIVYRPLKFNNDEHQSEREMRDLYERIENWHQKIGGLSIPPSAIEQGFHHLILNTGNDLQALESLIQSKTIPMIRNHYEK